MAGKSVAEFCGIEIGEGMIRLSAVGIPFALIGSLVYCNATIKYFQKENCLIQLTLGAVLIGIQIGILLSIGFFVFQD